MAYCESLFCLLVVGVVIIPLLCYDTWQRYRGWQSILKIPSLGCCERSTRVLHAGRVVFFASQRKWHPLSLAIIVGAAGATRMVGVVLLPILFFDVVQRYMGMIRLPEWCMSTWRVHSGVLLFGNTALFVGWYFNY